MRLASIVCSSAAAVAGDGRGDLFLLAGQLRNVVGQDPRFRQGRRQESTTSRMPRSCENREVASRRESEMMEWLGKDGTTHVERIRPKTVPSSARSTKCVEQLRRTSVGVQKLIFVPYRYEMEQIDQCARDNPATRTVDEASIALNRICADRNRAWSVLRAWPRRASTGSEGAE